MSNENTNPLRVLCVGAGHMGRSHALAYHQIDGFAICGIVTRSCASREKLNAELAADYPGFAVDEEAIYVTANMFTFGASGSYRGGRLWIIPKSPYYSGGAV